MMKRFLSALAALLLCASCAAGEETGKYDTLPEIFAITVEEAAISLGASKAKTFFLVTVPMMANGIISGAILSWVTIITELSTAICLYTVRTQTLTLAIYVYVSRGNDGIAAALATILSLTTVVSLCIFMKVSKSKDVTL